MEVNSAPRGRSSNSLMHDETTSCYFYSPILLLGENKIPLHFVDKISFSKSDSEEIYTGTIITPAFAAPI